MINWGVHCDGGTGETAAKFAFVVQKLRSLVCRLRESRSGVPISTFANDSERFGGKYGL